MAHAVNQMKKSPAPIPWLRHRVLRQSLWGILVLCGLLLAAVLFLPVLDGRGSRMRANEAVAVGKLREINTLQAKYAAEHPDMGFSCSLPALKSVEPPNQADDRSDFLLTETHAGYKLALYKCHGNPKGTIVHYQLTAVPAKQGVTGVRAFCTDDSGDYWYDSAGSGAECLKSRHPL